MKPRSIITEINENFVIRYWYESDPNFTFLKGAGQLHKLIGDELANKAFQKALTTSKDHYTRKFRTGLRIKFHRK